MEESSYIGQVQTALRVVNIGIEKQTLQLILAIGRKVEEKGLETNLMDITKTEAAIEKQYKKED